MITYKKGDLLNTTDLFIAHGCNAQGVMGSGVAKAIRGKYPKAYEDYRKMWELHMKLELGQIIPSYQPDGKVILHAITQDQYGYDYKKYVSYDAIDLAMARIAFDLRFSTGGGRQNISMPRIGAGLGGGDWRVIEAIINHRMTDHKVTIWEL